MRLTSYNIAVVAIKAECCLARYVGRMWDYIEEGDDEKIECAYEKAMQLSFLIDTLKRWKPTITSGKRLSVTATIESGTFPIPFFSNGTFIDGIRASSTFSVLSGGNSDVLLELVHATNCYISPDDDLVSVENFSFSPDTIQASFFLSDTIDPSKLEVDWLGGATWIVETETTEGITNTPYCLTDEEVLSIVEKIQKLCTCGC
jgi:hypothetical protein